MKRKLSLFLILMLAVQLVITIPSFAADNIYTVNTAEDFVAFFGKDGAKSYLMSQGYYVKLTSDIDLGNYIPNNSSFTGTFDGQGHKISYGIEIKARQDGIGLIGIVSNATVKNIILNGNINVTTHTVNIGGITGIAENTVIENCEVNLDINCIAGNNIGGIVGNISGESRISSCVFNGSKNGKMYAHYGTGGGIVGLVDTGNTKIENCINKVNISSVNWYISGIVGQCSGNITITGCRNFGDLTAESSKYGYKIGGIVGSVTNENITIDISECFNAGNITTKSYYAGSMVGSVSKNNIIINISDSYNTGEIAAVNNSAGSVIGGTSSEVGSQIVYSDVKEACAKDYIFTYNIKNFYDAKNKTLNPVAYKCETTENTERGVYILGASNNYGITEAALKTSLPSEFSSEVWEINSASGYEFPQLKSIGTENEIKIEYLAGNKMSGTVTSGTVIFNEDADGNIVASTYVTDIKKTTKLALILSEETEGKITASMVDIKDVSGGSEYTFTASLPMKEGSLYKAYVWNYSSLTPYTKIANYKSSDNTLKELNLGETKINYAVKEFTLNSITKDQIPVVTAVPLDNGTKVKVSVEGKTRDGKVIITITSQDNSQEETITINFAEVSDELKAWLSNSGIDVDAGITTYYIEENDIQ